MPPPTAPPRPAPPPRAAAAKTRSAAREPRAEAAFQPGSARRLSRLAMAATDHPGRGRSSSACGGRTIKTPEIVRAPPHASPRTTPDAAPEGVLAATSARVEGTPTAARPNDPRSSHSRMLTILAVRFLHPPHPHATLRSTPPVSSVHLPRLRRSIMRARCSCAFEVPAVTPSMRAISSCLNPSTSCNTNTCRGSFRQAARSRPRNRSRGPCAKPWRVVAPEPLPYRHGGLAESRTWRGGRA